MTAEFYRNIYQASDLRLRILGNKRVLGKTQIQLDGDRCKCPSYPSRNKFLVIVIKIYTKADFKVS